MLLTTAAGIWTYCYRNKQCSWESQPIFWGLLCISAFLVASAMLSLGNSRNHAPRSAQCWLYECVPRLLAGGFFTLHLPPCVSSKIHRMNTDLGDHFLGFDYLHLRIVLGEEAFKPMEQALLCRPDQLYFVGNCHYQCYHHLCICIMRASFLLAGDLPGHLCPWHGNHIASLSNRNPDWHSIQRPTISCIPRG